MFAIMARAYAKKADDDPEDLWSVSVAETNELLDTFKSHKKALAFAKYTFTVHAYSVLVITAPKSEFGRLPQLVTPTFGWPSFSVDDYKKDKEKEKKDKLKPPKPLQKKKDG
jgi:hypothetical protein